MLIIRMDAKEQRTFNIVHRLITPEVIILNTCKKQLLVGLWEKIIVKNESLALCCYGMLLYANMLCYHDMLLYDVCHDIPLWYVALCYVTRTPLYNVIIQCH